MITSIRKLLRIRQEEEVDDVPGNSHAGALTLTENVRQERQPLVTEGLKLDDRLELRDDGQTRVLIDNQSGTITTCNATAWAILNALKDGAASADIVQTLCRDFQVTEQHAGKDSLAFIRHLGDLGYLQEHC